MRRFFDWLCALLFGPIRRPARPILPEPPPELGPSPLANAARTLWYTNVLRGFNEAMARDYAIPFGAASRHALARVVAAKLATLHAVLRQVELDRLKVTDPDLQRLVVAELVAVTNGGKPSAGWDEVDPAAREHLDAVVSGFAATAPKDVLLLVGTPKTSASVLEACWKKSVEAAMAGSGPGPAPVLGKPVSRAQAPADNVIKDMLAKEDARFLEYVNKPMPAAWAGTDGLPTVPADAAKHVEALRAVGVPVPPLLLRPWEMTIRPGALDKATTVVATDVTPGKDPPGPAAAYFVVGVDWGAGRDWSALPAVAAPPYSPADAAAVAQWAKHFGDPADPVTADKIEKTAEALWSREAREAFVAGRKGHGSFDTPLPEPMTVTFPLSPAGLAELRKVTGDAEPKNRGPRPG